MLGFVPQQSADKICDLPTDHRGFCLQVKYQIFLAQTDARTPPGFSYFVINPISEDFNEQKIKTEDDTQERLSTKSLLNYVFGHAFCIFGRKWGWGNGRAVKKNYFLKIQKNFLAHMYSMVPQKVCVTIPSWICSLQSPKSVNLT